MGKVYYIFTTIQERRVEGFSVKSIYRILRFFFAPPRRKREKVEFYQKMPRNKREFALFIAIVSILSVNIIAPLITCFEMGFHLYVWADVLTVLPFIWLSVVALVFITYKFTEWLTARVVQKDDSFSAHVVVNIFVHGVFYVHFSDRDRHLDRR